MQFLNLILIFLNISYVLYIFNDCESVFNLITHYVLLNLLISNYVSHNTLCYITQLHTNSLILSLLWLWDHKVIIDCEKNCLMFNFTHCHQWCISAKTVIPCVSKNLLEFSVYKSFLNICIVSTVLIICLAQRKNHQLFITSLKNIEKALTSQETVNILIKLLREYYKFTILFFWEKFNKLSSYCLYDHIISLLSDKKSLKSLLYNIFRDELLMLQKYLKKHLFKNFIWVSSFSVIFSVIFIKKSESDLCLYVNYYSLNNLTVKNHYSLSLIRKTLNLLILSVIFTKLNIIAVFNKLWMTEEKKWKTAICTYYSLFKYLIMLFRLCEVSSFFQSYINDILWDCLNIFITAYIDNILIYSKNRKNH